MTDDTYIPLSICFRELWNCKSIDADFWNNDLSQEMHNKIYKYFSENSNGYLYNTKLLNDIQDENKNDFWYYYLFSFLSTNNKKRNAQLQISADLGNPYALYEIALNKKASDNREQCEKYAKRSMDLGYYLGAVLYIKCLLKFHNIEVYCSGENKKEAGETLNKALNILLEFHKKKDYDDNSFYYTISDLYKGLHLINYPNSSSEISYYKLSVVYKFKARKRLMEDGMEVDKILDDYMKLKKDY
jgi:hypothetical protein